MQKSLDKKYALFFDVNYIKGSKNKFIRNICVLSKILFG